MCWRRSSPCSAGCAGPASSGRTGGAPGVCAEPAISTCGSCRPGAAPLPGHGPSAPGTRPSSWPGWQPGPRAAPQDNAVAPGGGRGRPWSPAGRNRPIGRGDGRPASEVVAPGGLILRVVVPPRPWRRGLRRQGRCRTAFPGMPPGASDGSVGAGPARGASRTNGEAAAVLAAVGRPGRPPELEGHRHHVRRRRRAAGHRLTRRAHSALAARGPAALGERRCGRVVAQLVERSRTWGAEQLGLCPSRPPVDGRCRAGRPRFGQLRRSHPGLRPAPGRPGGRLRAGP